MSFVMDMSVPALMAALVALTNILTEVTKRVIQVKKAENAVLLWAVGLSAVAALLRVNGGGWDELFLALIEGVICGGVVAYAAMFGYDALYEKVPETLQSLVGYLNGRKKEYAE